jgi:DNA polymerase-3 subunit epsilon
LDELAEKFRISKKDRHTALGDTLITAIAFLAIMEKLKPKNLKDLFKKQNPPKFGL